MDEVILGPVFTTQNEPIIEGYIKKIVTFRNRLKQLECKMVKVYFNLNTLDNTFSIPVGHISDAIEIGKRLQKRGYNDLTLIFNDQKIIISEK